MVKKSDGGWRMCVDFVDINKACPKDCYPLPEIDWKVESLSGFRLKCFLDAYKGYHQIPMPEGDEDKTAFFAGEGVFCYRKMPFGLKNAGATYQRLVDKVFHDQIRRNLEAYVDDMVIKSTSKEEMLGIRANPSKVKAITDVEQLKTLKDVQSLNGKIAALSRFLSKGAKRSLLFFKVLKGCTDKKNIRWTQEAEASLQEMKKFVEILTTLTVPVQGDVLMMYLTDSTESISAALFAKREEEQQGGYEGGDETPKDFLIEVPLEDNKKEAEEKADTNPTKTKLSCEWKLFTDGAASFDGFSAGLMLVDPEGKEYTYALRFGFETTNNKAEYEALLVGLRISQEMEITSLAIFVDSQLLVNQIKGTYVAKQPTTREYLQKTKESLKDFESYTIEHIRRNQNKKADALSKLASMTFEHLTKEVLVEVLPKRSIEEKEILQVKTKEGESWMAPIHEYLVSGLLPKDPKESRKIRVKAPQYKTTINGGQNYEARILLVVNASRRYKGTSRLREMQGAIRDKESSRKQRDNSRNRRTLHEMGGSKTSDPYKRKACRNIVWEYVVCRFGVLRTISSKDKKYFREGIFADLYKVLKVTQSFSPITNHMEITNHIEKQLARSQQGWVDDLAQVLCVHRTLPRNSQKETPFSLTYGSEAIIPISKSDVAKDDRGRIKEVDKRRGSKEIASIKEAYYRSKLRRHHNKRSSHSIYKIRDFVLLSQNNT
ncbi:reverse transcriptase domain-containing protein [Tanacetum coccineum]